MHASNGGPGLYRASATRISRTDLASSPAIAVRRPQWPRVRPWLLPLVLVLAGAWTTANPPSAGASGLQVQTVWTSPIDYASGVAFNSTARDVATVPVAGRSIVVTLSNQWSSTPTTFAAVSVGVQQRGDTIVPGSILPVTFHHGSGRVTIAPYGLVTSDPVPMAVHARESIAVSMANLGAATVSVHYCCFGRVDSYATNNGAGNLTASPSALAFNPFLASTTMRWLSAIAVEGTPAQGTVVAFGDSITDGFGYSNRGFSWVNALQARIAKLPPSQQVSVVNEGMAGGTLTAFPPDTTYERGSGGEPGVTRFGADALSLYGVRDVILFLGTNDIWFGAGGVTGHPIPPYGTAGAIETAMQQVITAAHQRGVHIFDVTLLPRSSSSGVDGEKPEYWSASEQSILSEVNTWMLSGRTGFDSVINLAAVMGDVYNGACEANLPFPAYFNLDHLHPNVAGQTALANAISTSLFDIPQAPPVRPLVAARLTGGCGPALQAAGVLALGTLAASTTTLPTPTTPPPATSAPQVQPSPRPSPHGRRYLTYFALALAAFATVTLWDSRRRARQRRLMRRRLRHLVQTSNQPPRSPPPALPVQRRRGGAS